MNLCNRLRLSSQVYVAGLQFMLLLACPGAFATALCQDPLAVPPKQWATDAANNEIKVIQYDRTYLRYQVHAVGNRGDLVREVVESKQGSVARLIMKENRPLTAEEDAAEQQRLQAMLDSPSAFAKHTREDQSGKKMAVELIRLLPEAMIYSYAPGQPQRARTGPLAGDGPEVVLDFKPDPAWNPPSMTAQALTGLTGRVWIDNKTHFLTRMEGTIFRKVNFGWAVVAQIYPGGKLLFEQDDVNDQRWIFTHFSEHLTVRAMMVKTLNENSDIRGSEFTPVAEMNYQDAIHMLLSMPLPGH